jgi:eukaryotic-like serine/threonine-protein kinase
LGRQYVLDLNAVNCQTGDALARDQVKVSSKEGLLAAMDAETASLRVQLGESLTSIHKFSAPVEQATTSSFEALKDFSLGQEARTNKGPAEAMPFFQRTVDLDPTFAMAYGALGSVYFSMGKDDLGVENVRRAYELRDRASERERFRVASYYSAYVTDDIEKMRENCEEWALAYPRDWEARDFLGNALSDLGNPLNAAEEHSESVRLNPDSLLPRANLVFNYLTLGRLELAEAALRDGEQRNGFPPAPPAIPRESSGCLTRKLRHRTRV